MKIKIKIPNKILSVFNKAVTTCPFCPCNFKGSLQEGNYWLVVIHLPMCLEFKRSTRLAFESIK